MSDIQPNPTSLRGAVDLTSLVNRAMTSGQSPAGATPTPGAGVPAAGEEAVVPLPSLYFEGTDANFNDFLDLSATVPVVVDLWAEWSEPSKQLSSVLDRVVRDYEGRFVLVRVDVDANPQLSQAFQAQSVPAVAAVIGGRPVQLFAGAIPEAQIRDVFEQLLQLAAQNGVTGRASVEDASGEPQSDGETPEPVPEPLPPHHAEAYEAIERGDYAAAVEEYKTAIAQNPRDFMAVAGLAQVSLLARLDGKTLEEIRAAAAEGPKDVDAQLLVADLDLSGGHVEDAFDRLLALFPSLDADGKNAVRARLLDYFEIVGVDDPRVNKARARLTSLLY
jgi:putative thioredoxin